MCRGGSTTGHLCSSPRCARSPKTRARPYLQNSQTTSYVHRTHIHHHSPQFHSQGKNLIHLIDRKDEPYCFRLHKDKVYYVSESSMRLSISVARSNLVTLGTCFGKFSKSGKFKLHVTALDHIAQYAKYKVYLLFIAYTHLRSFQGLDQTQWRDALPVWQPRPQGTPWSNNRRHSRAPGRGRIQHE